MLSAMPLTKVDDAEQKRKGRTAEHSIIWFAITS